MASVSGDRSVGHRASPAPVLIDTDPGLDDALAIFLAFAAPELEIAGIVTVAGNIGLQRVTENALNLLDHLDRDVPVVAGASRPLSRKPLVAADIHGEDGLGGIDLPRSERHSLACDAIDFIEGELLRHPDRSLSILALGPLTNVARLVETRPKAAARVRRIIAMGGAVRDRGNVTPFAEFNIAADPEAAATVLRSSVPLTLVPLDVTRKVVADRSFCARLRAQGGRSAAIAAELIEAYLGNLARIRVQRGLEATAAQPPAFPLHDPCVMLHAIDPSLFRAERLPIRVVADGSERDGQTVIDSAEGVMIEVLVEARSEAALALAFELLVGLP
jgi:purine nucleosidase/pyrimidine-specific ribonucleoside hydrolase